MKALIIYNSQKGTTKKYAMRISQFLKDRGIDSNITSIYDFESNDASSSELVFLGCWTSGLFFFGQHPEQAWIDFAKKLPDMKGKKLVLFTTYKLATGSMFKKMKAHLKGEVLYEMKSRNGELTEENKKVLKEI